MRNAKPPLFWLRFPHEVSACPACQSADLVLIEPFKIQRDAQRRRVAFLTGCRGCGLLFANPLPTGQDLERQYSPQGSWQQGRKARAAKPPSHVATRDARDVLLEALAPFVPVGQPPSGARVLDFGCGDGKFLDRLQDAGWQTFGIEPSTSAAFVRHQQLDRVPPDGVFDFAILHHVLEHVVDPLAILRQIAAGMREGGILFVGVPRLDTLPEHGDVKYCVDGRHHLVAMSDVCLQGLLARAGFAVVARLDAEALDREITGGKPLRLRVVARRTSQAQALPAEPLRPARVALRRYRSAVPAFGGAIGELLPVRMRGALLDQAIERRARIRRRERANAAEINPVKPQSGGG